MVERVLDKHYYRFGNNLGPSWLTFLGHIKDSLWSIDFFRLESMHLKSHRIMLVMDQFTRWIIGFAIHDSNLNGPVICRMFNSIIAQHDLPRYLSSDHDPLFEYHQWQANLRILNIDEIKSVPYTPISHPFVERLIGTIRREFTDNILFWNILDLAKKLREFQHYYNQNRAHSSRNKLPPQYSKSISTPMSISANDLIWETHCQGLFQLPIAA